MTRTLRFELSRVWLRDIIIRSDEYVRRKFGNACPRYKTRVGYNSMDKLNLIFQPEKVN